MTRSQFATHSDIDSEDDFSTLFDLLPIGAYRTTPDGRQLRANAALVRMNGYGSEPAMLAGVRDIAKEWYVVPHRRYEFMALMASKGRVIDFVSEVYRHKTRERIWVREHAHAVYDDRGEILFYEGTAEDISQRRQIQERLRDSEQRFRSLTELSADWYWEQDADFCFIRFDGSVEKSGLPSECTLGKTRWEIGALNLSEADWDAHRDILYECEPFKDFEIQRHHPSVGTYWMSVSGQPIFDATGEFCGYRGIGRNITARKKAVENALMNEALLHTLIQTIPDRVWLKSTEGIYLACNSAFEAYMGLPASNIIGKTDAELVNADLALQFTRTDRAAIEALRPVSFEEECVLGPDGSIGTYEIVKTAMRDVSGNVTGVLGMGRNITERKRAEERLRDTTEQLELAIIGTELGLWHYDLAHDPFKRMDTRACAMLGLTVEEYEHGGVWPDRIHPEDLPHARMEYQRHLDGQAASYNVEFRAQHKLGHWVWLNSRGRVIQTNDRGEPVRLAGTLMDITERKKSEETIRQMAFQDVLTSLPNRRLLMNRLQRALEVNLRNKQHGALLFLDLDHFKKLNDSLGHDVGDLLLHQVAERLKNSVRAVDTVARLGGDEFVVLIEDLNENIAEALAQTRVVGEKILAALNEPYQLGEHAYHSTPSIGATIFNDAVLSPVDVLKRADVAMYEAKESGRNTLIFAAES
ncbi:MAG: hypothetical protein RIS34_1770 [Pseudomonadota bacterium]|jgi:diguanylate cyclase (GGDEF)-like protein/PAS domain S-box-containing protein